MLSTCNMFWNWNAWSHIHVYQFTYFNLLDLFHLVSVGFISFQFDFDSVSFVSVDFYLFLFRLHFTGTLDTTSMIQGRQNFEHNIHFFKIWLISIPNFFFSSPMDHFLWSNNTRQNMMNENCTNAGLNV